MCHMSPAFPPEDIHLRPEHLRHLGHRYLKSTTTTTPSTFIEACAYTATSPCPTQLTCRGGSNGPSRSGQQTRSASDHSCSCCMRSATALSDGYLSRWSAGNHDEIPKKLRDIVKDVVLNAHAAYLYATAWRCRRVHKGDGTASRKPKADEWRGWDGQQPPPGALHWSKGITAFIVDEITEEARASNARAQSK